MKLRRRWLRLRALFQQRRADRELRSEIEAHLELAELEARERGLSPQEARRRALLELGSVERVREEHREVRSMLWLEHLALDVRYAFASLVRTPLFTATVLAVLALGLGASVAMFSVVDELFLEELPYPEPERIVRVWKVPFPGSINSAATLDFVDWNEQSSSFEALAARAGGSATLTGVGEPERLRGELVSAEFFKVFGVDPLYGRGLRPEDDELGAEPVVLLSHVAWQNRFAGDPEVLGRRLILDRVSHEVVGILPPGVWDRRDVDYWKPLAFTQEQRTRGFLWLEVLGRLRDGVTLAQAQEEMEVIDAEVSELAPFWRREWGVLLEPYRDRLLPASTSRSVLVAFAAVLLLLVIACANVTNLLLARGSTRRAQYLLRAALGATRWRLLTQQIVEVLALFLVGGALGAPVAFLGVRSLASALAESLPAAVELDVDWTAFAFGAALLSLTALFVVLLPARQLTRQLHTQGPRSNVRTGASGGVRSGLVVAEVAGTLVLLSLALLLGRSLMQLQQVETGVRMENVVSVSVNIPLEAYRRPEDAARFADQLLEQVRGRAGVSGAALSTDLPLREVNEGQGVLPLAGEGGMTAGYKRVSEGYFEALGISLREGRGFDSRDRYGATPVAVVNEELARRLGLELEIEDPLGKSVNISTPYYVEKGGELVETRIVGVLRSERVAALGEANDSVIYVPLSQVPTRSFELIVRSASSSLQLASLLRAAVADVDPLLALGPMTTLAEVRRDSLQDPSRLTLVIGSFAAAAALLSGLGVFGLLSYAVTQRRQQIGVRMALGADRSDVLMMVLRSGLRLVLVGTLLGLAGTAVVARALSSLLFGVSALDPIALAGAIGATAVVGVLAGLAPAWRAARLDPVVALRLEE